jgi:hypothetical protein
MNVFPGLFLLHENHPNKWNAVQMRTNESRVIIGFSGFEAVAVLLDIALITQRSDV